MFLHRRLLLIVSFFFVHCFHSALAVFDPTKPHVEENFDPAEANPEHNLTCVGPLPPWPLPRFPEFDPNNFTLQQLCAKPQYGGRAPQQHLGAACFKPRHDDRGAIFFDTTEASKVARDLVNPRILLYCRTRCFCNRYRHSGNVTLPRDVSPMHGTQYHATWQSYQIKIDEVDDFAVPWHQHTTEVGELRPMTPINYGVQAGRTRLLYHLLVSIPNAANVTCQGPVPRALIPEPYASSDFQNLQKLCAVQLNGGHAWVTQSPHAFLILPRAAWLMNIRIFSFANAGGYCHRNSDGSRDVAFTDEMTPRVDWTWAGNFLVSANLRFYCWQRCTCQGVPLPVGNRPLATLWHFLSSADLVEDPDGLVTLKALSRVGLAASSIAVRPANAVDGSPAAGSCGADGKQYCYRSWPTDLLGPIPQLTPLPAADPKLTTTRFPMCGSTCVSNADCRGPGSEGGCRCIVPSDPETSAKGLDFVFPQAFCFVISQMMINGVGNNKLGGEKRRDLAEERLRFACPCNVTYVSAACCDDADGLVWEDPGLKLGRLAQDTS
ncbi:MAG: hypothetical protein M1817_001985 [Caeruleum heppii]|nr:MAG: hypothetical protein M1817_001985 [Caeruleum heppii]